MKKGRGISIIVVLFAVFFISTLSAQAALELRGTDISGNRLIYDNDLNITWYDYTNSYNRWQNQVSWADALSVTFGSNTYTDWRLPSTVDGPWSFDYDGTTTAGYNITSSEMGHLFYTELGNKGAYDTFGTPQSGGLTKTGDFQHLQSGAYWSGTEYSVPGYSWYFNTMFGYQDEALTKGLNFYAIAVRPGDVSVAVVPEPMSMILFGTGGALLAGRYIRRKA